MRYIVLGGTGYLGSKVVRRLVADNHEVLCVVRSFSSLEKLNDIEQRIHCCKLDQLQDYLDNEASFDCLLNLACKYPRNSQCDMDIFEANLRYPLEAFTKSFNGGVKKFVTIGTGLPDNFNVYALSKAKLAEIMKWYGEQARFRNQPVKICNILLENFYGEDEPTNRFISGTVARMKKNEQILLTEGNQVRDFIYIEDVLDSIIDILYSNDLPEFLDLPLGTGEGVSIRNLMIYLKEILQSESELCFGAVPSRINEPDSIADKEIMAQYGISAKHSWKEGMKKFVCVETEK